MILVDVVVPVVPQVLVCLLLNDLCLVLTTTVMLITKAALVVQVTLCDFMDQRTDVSKQ